MKFKKSDKNIFAEGLENSILHPYVKSSFNFVTEDLDDEVDVNSEDVPETPKPGVETGFSNMLIDAINGEWDTINLYNSIIATLSQEKDKKYDAIIKVLQDITNEENVHVGQLQKALELLSPNTASIADGEKEAQEQISADDYDDMFTESLLFEDEENTLEKQADIEVDVNNSEENNVENSKEDGSEEEEQTPREQLNQLLASTSADDKDANTAEKLIITNSNTGSKETIKDSILKNYTDDSIDSEQLETFEKIAKQVGQDVNIGDIAKKYGITTESILDQIVDSSWSEDKVNLTLYALTSSIFVKPEQYMKVALSLADKVPDEKIENVLGELKKLKSFAE